MMAQWLLLVLCGFSSAYAQSSSTCSTSQEGDVQLVQTTSITLLNAGRVEVCHNGMWGTICADSLTTPWSEKNAQVVCRQRGYSGALNSILQDTVDFLERPSSSVPIHYRSVRCFGQEDRLTDCPGISDVTGSCSHTLDAHIVCRPRTLAISPVHTVSPQHGDIRLFADSDNGEGAVEFYHRSFGWTGICPDSSWGTSEARVACRQLGYETGRATTYGSVSSTVISQRLLSSFACSDATHTTLSMCTFSATTSCLFSSSSFAGIQCSSSSTVSTGSVRLFGGSTGRGIVEVFYDGRWGPVCSSSWGSSDARVVCGELGFNRGDTSSYTSTGTNIESNLKPIWLTRSVCSSSATQLTRDCTFSDPTGFVNCRSLSFAGADCGVDPSGLSASAIGGIVFGILFVIGALIALWFIKGKTWWSNRESYSWYRTMTHPRGWISWSPSSSTRTTRVTVETPRRASIIQEVETAETTTTTTTRRQSSSSSSSDITDSETEQPPQNPDAEITKAAPPSYRAASNYPAAEPSQAPSTDLPPPYLGPPTDLRYSGGATAGYPPPASSNYPPVGPNYQGYPPPTNFAYPPSSGAVYPGSSAPELAFPPNTGAPYPTTITTDTQQHGGLPYPTGDVTPYPPNPTDVAPYPPNTVPYPSPVDTEASAPPPQLDTPYPTDIAPYPTDIAPYPPDD